jgi:hypothetical protein
MATHNNEAKNNSWADIESAPRDGTIFLGSDGQELYLAAYDVDASSDELADNATFLNVPHGSETEPIDLWVSLTLTMWIPVQLGGRNWKIEGEG